MDEAAASAAIAEDGAEKRPHDEDGASENHVGSSAEDTADGEYPVVQNISYMLRINAGDLLHKLQRRDMK